MIEPPMRTTRLLFDSPLLEVADVTCTAPRSGYDDEEWAGASQVVLPRSGTFVVHRRRSPEVVDPNTALVFGSGEHYRVGHPTSSGDRCVVLVFSPGIVEEACAADSGLVAPFHPRTRVRTSRFVAALASDALNRMESEEAALRLLVEIAPGARPAGDAPSPAAARRVDEARVLLAERPTLPWRLDDLARAVRWSPFHLARRFRAATGESVSRYLLHLRLAMALERLEEGERDLGRLATDLGFAHHSHFTARFRSVFGETPSAVRASLSRTVIDRLRTIVTAPPHQSP